MFVAKLRDRRDDLLSIQPAADDGVAAVDVGGHVREAGLGEFFAKRLDGQLRFSSDAAEENEIDDAFHRAAIVGSLAVRFNSSAATARRRVPWAIASGQRDK